MPFLVYLGRSTRVPAVIGCSREKRPQTGFENKGVACRRFDALVQSPKITSPLGYPTVCLFCALGAKRESPRFCSGTGSWGEMTRNAIIKINFTIDKRSFMGYNK